VAVGPCARVAMYHTLHDLRVQTRIRSGQEVQGWSWDRAACCY